MINKKSDPRTLQLEFRVDYSWLSTAGNRKYSCFKAENFRGPIIMESMCVPMGHINSVQTLPFCCTVYFHLFMGPHQSQNPRHHGVGLRPPSPLPRALWDGPLPQEGPSQRGADQEVLDPFCPSTKKDQVRKDWTSLPMPPSTENRSCLAMNLVRILASLDVFRSAKYMEVLLWILCRLYTSVKALKDIKLPCKVFSLAK